MGNSKTPAKTTKKPAARTASKPAGSASKKPAAGRTPARTAAMGLANKK